MRKIIVGALKDSIENFVLIWLLFFTNVFAGYIVYGLGFHRSTVVAASFSVLIIYLFSLVLQALILDRAVGNWPWRKVFYGALMNFPVMAAWILIPLALTAIILILSVPPLKENSIVGALLVFFIAAYVLAPAAVSLYEGGNLKKSFKAIIGLISKKTASWLLSAVFMGILLILTGALSEFLTSAAASATHGYRKIVGTLYIVTAEFIKAGSVVVVLATLVRLNEEDQEGFKAVEQK